jgi:ribosomal protein S25
MNAEQRAIIALAEKEGVSPIEKDARLIVHGMVNATREQMRKYQVGFNNMGEAQQDAVIGDLTKAYEDLAITIARALASAGTPSVVMQCKDLKVSNGTFTGIVKSDQDHYNDLISKVQDKGEVVMVLYERQYRDAMDDIQADKDQKSLPLDSEEPSKPEKKQRAASGAKSAGAMAKAIELPAKLVEDARKFIVDQQNCKASALQNYLKCNFGKAEALQKLFEAEGLIEFVGTDASGDYELVRAKTEATGVLGLSPDDEAALVGGSDDKDEAPITALTDELYDRIVAKTTEKGSTAAGAIAVTFDISFEIAEQAFDRMELEGVIDAEGNLAESETFPVMD